MMPDCIHCGSKLKKGPQEISRGIFVEAWGCPKCGEAYADLEGYAAYYEAVQRRAFKIGGSIAIRLPKKLADELRIRDGTPVRFRRQGKRLIVEPAES